MEVRRGSTAAFFFFFGRDVSRETAKVRSDAVDSSADAVKLNSLLLDLKSDAVDSSADAADLSISTFFVSLGT